LVSVIVLLLLIWPPDDPLGLMGRSKTRAESRASNAARQRTFGAELHKLKARKRAALMACETG